MPLPPGVTGDAHPHGRSKYRHWLSRTWASTGQVALVIGINPNAATEADDDGMTRFLTRLLRGLECEYACRGYVLVNCCDVRHRDPRELEDIESPCSESNVETIRRMLAECDFVVASWGTTDYGQTVAGQRRLIEALVRESGKRVICFSPKGLPIYCSQTSANTKDSRWSSKPVVWSPGGFADEGE